LHELEHERDELTKQHAENLMQDAACDQQQQIDDTKEEDTLSRQAAETICMLEQWLDDVVTQSKLYQQQIAALQAANAGQQFTFWLDVCVRVALKIKL